MSSTPKKEAPLLAGKPFSLLVMGASAGGLAVFRQILSALPDDFPIPVLIVLHCAPLEQGGPATVLQRYCKLLISEPEDKEPLISWRVYVAPSGYHMLVEPGVIALSSDQPVHYSRPSIDALFKSAARAYGNRVLGILMTGANEDGARGLLEIKKMGGCTIAQDPVTAESPFMPAAALRMDAAEYVCSIDDVASSLQRYAADSHAGASQNVTGDASMMHSAPETPTVLLVDDDPGARMAMEDILKSDAYNLVIARNGEEALKRILEISNLALIITDIAMPGMDGFELAQFIKRRAQTSGIPICFLTATYQDQQRAMEAYTMGAVDYLSKPVNPNVIRAKVNVFAELHLQKQTLQALNKKLQEQTEILDNKNQRLRVSEERLRTALNEKETLLKEVHHRVKNNMQIISSLLNLRAGGSSDAHVQSALTECSSRIQAMSMIHERLYSTGVFGGVEFDAYLKDLIGTLWSGLAPADGRVQLKMNFEKAFVSLDSAIPLGLIANELILNAMKYAFPNGRGGDLVIELKQLAGNRLEFSVCDTGIGLPKDFDFDKANSLGLKLVRALTMQIRGEVKFEGPPGTCVRINWLQEAH
jgi:chemotaxis response regulator CheB